MLNVSDKWREVNAAIAQHARGPVTVVAVTKGRPVDDIRAVVAAGATVLGENRIEEVERKIAGTSLARELASVQVHMIGHVQSRKAREAVKLFACIQSVDSVKLAREIEKRCIEADIPGIDVLIEANVSGEEQKYGVRPAEVAVLVDEMLRLPHLRLKGLMTMAPYVEDERVLRSVFGGLRTLGESLGREYGAGHFAVLSMGMSHDYRIACEEGSTMVRIGTALFEQGKALVRSLDMFTDDFMAERHQPKQARRDSI